MQAWYKWWAPRLSSWARPLLPYHSSGASAGLGSVLGYFAAAHDLQGRIFVIGFGRFGQIASQGLLAKGVDLSAIHSDPDRIRDAKRYGFTVFYGDGTRLDTLRHSGAATADAVMICIDDPKAALQIVELVRHEFPQAKLLVRSYDRGHAMELIRAGVDFQISETVESAYLMGAEGLRALGFAEADAAEAAEDIRQRDSPPGRRSTCECFIQYSLKAILPMTWIVEHTNAFEEWWQTLTVSEKTSVAAYVGLLEECGPALPFP